CRLYRETGGRDAKKGINIPHKFFYRKYQNNQAIVLPFTSSENRVYLPVKVLEKDVVPSNGVLVIYSETLYIFSLLNSNIHNIWCKLLSGKLESRIRYSVNIVYNTFPFPKISKLKEEELE